MGCSSSAQVLSPSDPCDLCPHANPDGTPIKRKFAAFFCLHCEKSLCSGCKNDHERSYRPTRTHHIVPYKEFKSGRWEEFIRERREKRCPRHVTQDLIFFCIDHKGRTCDDCNEEDHKGCKIGTLETLEAQFSEEVGRLVRKIQKTERLMTAKSQELQTRHNDMGLLEGNLQDQIEERGIQVVESVQVIKQQRKREIEEASAKKDQDLVDLAEVCQKIASDAIEILGRNKDALASALPENRVKTLMEVKQDLTQRATGLGSVDTESIEKALTPLKFYPVEGDGMAAVGAVFGHVRDEDIVRPRGDTGYYTSRSRPPPTRSSDWSDASCAGRSTRQNQPGYRTSHPTSYNSQGPPPSYRSTSNDRVAYVMRIEDVEEDEYIPPKTRQGYPARNSQPDYPTYRDSRATDIEEEDKVDF